MPIKFSVTILLLLLWPASFTAAANSDYLTLNIGDTAHQISEKLAALTAQGIISWAAPADTFIHQVDGSKVMVSLTFVDDQLDQIKIASATSYPVSHCDSPWLLDIQQYLAAMETRFGPPTKDYNYPSIADPEATMGSITLAGKWILEDKAIYVGVNDSRGDFTPLIIIRSTPAA